MTDNNGMNNSDKEVRREPPPLSFHPESKPTALRTSSSEPDENAWIADLGNDPALAYAEAYLSQAKDQLVGKILFGTYHILEVLGEGAMGLVYKAKHLAFERMVAMKTLKTLDPDIVMRFKHEVKVHSSLKHQNIVEAIDCFEAPTKQTFFVMEFIEGVSLEDLVKSTTICDSDLYSILSQVCDALIYAHANGIVHRDLKPGNIMLIERDGVPLVKVVDFGMAKIYQDVQKITKTGQAVGSPLYMSAEQCMGMEIDGRADQYSLAIVAYEMITGCLPFVGKTLVETMEKHCNEAVRARSLMEHGVKLKSVEMLDTILARALESDRDKRYQSITEFKKALEFWYKTTTTGGAKVELPTDLRPVQKEEGKTNPRSNDRQAAEKIETARSDPEKPRKTSSFNKDQQEFHVRPKAKIPVIGWIVLVLAVLVLCLFGMLLGVSYVLSVMKPEHSAPAQSPPLSTQNDAGRTTLEETPQSSSQTHSRAKSEETVATPSMQEKDSSATRKGENRQKPVTTLKRKLSPPKVKATSAKPKPQNNPKQNSRPAKSGSFEGLLKLKD